MDAREMKIKAAAAALAHVEDGMRLGIGTGSTAEEFVRLLAEKVADGLKVEGVPTSERTARLCVELGVPLKSLDELPELDLTIDGADEIDDRLRLIKGGGGALTREKIVAAVARTFVCIADQSKLVPALGRFPLPVEVIPMARSHVARELRRLGGEPRPREGFVTDNGNLILDVHGLQITDPVATETHINQIVGVVTNGLFAARGADVLLLAGDHLVEAVDQIFHETDLDFQVGEALFGVGGVGHGRSVDCQLGRLRQHTDLAHVFACPVLGIQRAGAREFAPHEAPHRTRVGAEQGQRVGPRALGAVDQARGGIGALLGLDAAVHEGLAAFGGAELVDDFIEGGVFFQVAVFAQAQHDVEHGAAGDVFDHVGHVTALVVGHGLRDPGHGLLVREALRCPGHVVEQGAQHPHRIQIAGHGNSVDDVPGGARRQAPRRPDTSA